MKKIIFILLFLLIFSGLGYLQYSGYFWYNSIFTRGFEIRGLDISHHQGKIDWKKVTLEKKYSFVYIKSTEGSDFTDKEFKQNWNNSIKNGLKVGAYHYFSMRSNGKEQAKNFISIVPKNKNSLPPVIDLEISSIHDKKEVEKQLSSMIKILEKYYDKKVILYLTYDSYNIYIKDSILKNKKIWFRDIFKRPSIGKKRWVFWQYSNRGNVDGINGFVDQSVFYGKEKEFNILLNK